MIRALSTVLSPLGGYISFFYYIMTGIDFLICNLRCPCVFANKLFIYLVFRVCSFSGFKISIAVFWPHGSLDPE